MIKYFYNIDVVHNSLNRFAAQFLPELEFWALFVSVMHSSRA